MGTKKSKARQISGGGGIRKYVVGQDFAHRGLVNHAAYGTFYSKFRWPSGSVKI